MRKLLFILLAFCFTGCKAQDFIGWVGTQSTVFSVRFGFMYPYSVVPTTSHASLIASGWDFITTASWNDIYAATSPYGNRAGALKSTNSDHWNIPNNATNELLLSLSGSGLYLSGAWTNIRITGYVRGRSTTVANDWFISNYISNTTVSVAEANDATWKNYLLPILACRAATGQPNGQIGTYTGNDGKIYPTIVINGWEITSVPLCETKFRDGTDIVYAGSTSDINTYNSSGTPYYSYYDFIQSNAYPQP